MELGGTQDGLATHCIPGTSQEGLCQALDPGASSVALTQLLLVPGNLVEKQNPRPTLGPLASPTGALCDGNSPLCSTHSTTHPSMGQ